MLLLLWLALFEALNLAGVRSGGRPLHQLCFVISGAEYTPLKTHCQQYIVVLSVLGAIQCIEPHSTRILKVLLARRASVGKQQLVIADIAVVTVERSEGVGGLFEHLFGHRD